MSVWRAILGIYLGLIWITPVFIPYFTANILHIYNGKWKIQILIILLQTLYWPIYWLVI
jgi:hypothetical protein